MPFTSPDKPPRKRKGNVNQRAFRHNKYKKQWCLQNYQDWWASSGFVHLDDGGGSSLSTLLTKRCFAAKDAPNLNDGIRIVKIKKRPQQHWAFVIAFIYEQVLSNPPKSEWNERCGTEYQIMKMLGMSRGSRGTVTAVLKKCDEADRNGTELDLSRKKQKYGPRELKLEEGSIYEWLATDYLERGCSATLTAFMINIHLHDDGKDMQISEHCIRHLIIWLSLLSIKLASDLNRHRSIMTGSMLDTTGPVISYQECNYIKQPLLISSIMFCLSGWTQRFCVIMDCY